MVDLNVPEGWSGDAALDEHTPNAGWKVNACAARMRTLNEIKQEQYGHLPKLVSIDAEEAKIMVPGRTIMG